MINPTLFQKKRICDRVKRALVIYSLRRLRANYAGACIRVRRSSDDTVLDIGFIGDFLDVASLLAFANGGSCYIATWYDQSGNGNYASQSDTTKQPMIVSDGALITQNGKPSIKFTAASGHYLASVINIGISGNSSFGIYAVFAHTTFPSYGGVCGWGSTSTAGGSVFFGSRSTIQESSYVGFLNGGQYYDNNLPYTALHVKNFTWDSSLGNQSNSTNSYIVRTNGEAKTLSVSANVTVNIATNKKLYIGATGSTPFYLDGYISEVFLFNLVNNLRAIRAIEINQMVYYRSS